jgi:hypothetical protein
VRGRKTPGSCWPGFWKCRLRWPKRPLTNIRCAFRGRWSAVLRKMSLALLMVPPASSARSVGDDDVAAIDAGRATLGGRQCAAPDTIRARTKVKLRQYPPPAFLQTRETWGAARNGGSRTAFSCFWVSLIDLFRPLKAGRNHKVCAPEGTSWTTLSACAMAAARFPRA